MDVKTIVEQQRAHFDTGATLDVDARIGALLACAEIRRSQRRIADALAFDLGNLRRKAMRNRLVLSSCVTT
ncbi:MAG: hypothetical protein ACLTQI_03905 [Slackia sp.]